MVWTLDHVSNKPGCMVASVPLDGCHAASGAPDPMEQQLKTPVRYACDAMWHLLDLLARGTYPLVICYIAIENGHRNSGFSH